MKNPLVSIIVPVYNVQDYLVECLFSIINQDYKNIEVIIVDDGSTDNSGFICDSISAKDKRVKVTHKTNGGLSSARNCGLELINGEYFCFVDSDDCVSNNYVSRLLFFALKNDSDICICNFHKFDEKSILHKNENYEIIIENISLTNPDFYNLINPNKHDYLYITVWNRIYKSSSLKNIKFIDGISNEDEFVALNYFSSSKKITLVKDYLYYYRVRNDSIMSKTRYSPKRLNAFYALYDRALFFKKIKQTDNYKDTIIYSTNFIRNSLEWLPIKKYKCLYFKIFIFLYPHILFTKGFFELSISILKNIGRNIRKKKS